LAAAGDKSVKTFCVICLDVLKNTLG